MGLICPWDPVLSWAWSGFWWFLLALQMLLFLRAVSLSLCTFSLVGLIFSVASVACYMQGIK